MCYIEGSVCVVSADFLAVPIANAGYDIAALPNGVKPLGHAHVDQTANDDTAYIAPLRYRGDDSICGQIRVMNSGNINVYVNRAGGNFAYYYGQVVFPVTHS